MKKKLPAVTIQSEVCEQRKREFCRNNAVLCLDLDDIEDIEAAKQEIAALPYVFAVWVSASGRGLVVLIALPNPVEDLKPVLKKVQKNFKYPIDNSCSDTSRLRYASHDPELIVKDNVIPFGGKREARPEKIGIDVLDTFLHRIQKISFDETECERAGVKTYYILSIDHLMETAEEHGLAIGSKNQIPHFFNECFWQRLEWDTFRYFLQVVGTKQGIPYGIIKDHKFVEHLVKQFLSVARFPILTKSNTPKINLRNGTLHFTPDGTELKPFDMNDGLCYQLDYDYDPSATAPLFKKFFERVQPDRAVRKLLWQYIAYVFLPHLNLEKILFLYGGGDNGKSVFLSVSKALIGDEQCCAYTLEGITRHEYQRAALGNHLLNICTEISTRMGGTDVFKKLASREPLQARFPYGRPFIVKDYATSVFSMNELPKDVEQTRAFFRRFLLIPFEVQIPEEDKDTDLSKKIISREMSGVLNYVVRGVKSLLASGGFDIPSSVQNAVENFRKESDSVLTFLDENRFQPSSEHWKTLSDLYWLYRQQCSTDGSCPVSKRTFSKRLRDFGYKSDTTGKKKQTVVYLERAE